MQKLGDPPSFGTVWECNDCAMSLCGCQWNMRLSAESTKNGFYLITVNSECKCQAVLQQSESEKRLAFTAAHWSKPDLHNKQETQTDFPMT